MSGDRVERRLAAILAADVAGYSRLMGQDEARTLSQLKAHRRELIDLSIAEHKGRGFCRAFFSVGVFALSIQASRVAARSAFTILAAWFRPVAWPQQFPRWLLSQPSR